MSFVRILWNSLRVARESQSVVIEKCSITNVSISVWKFDSGSGMRSALDVGNPQIRHQHTRRKTFLLAHRLSVNDLSFRLIKIRMCRTQSGFPNRHQMPRPSDSRCIIARRMWTNDHPSLLSNNGIWNLNDGASIKIALSAYVMHLMMIWWAI